jgi:peptidoglycan/xylan/chitin deacetylase (PgdA/CDA1 family)
MILLSFDIEEFDLPKEHHVDIPFEEQMKISIEGTKKILSCLKQQDIKATFFCTANFALHAPEIIKSIQADHHEIASHGYNHWTFEINDLKKSKEALEDLTGNRIYGYRQARMMPVPETKIYDAGYRYNSSLNPTFIPGRYLNFNVPRTPFLKDGVLQLPSSVTPILRFPLFWFTAHHLPVHIYTALCQYTHKHDDYLLLYFHPWEFVPLREHPEYHVPRYISRNTGDKMLEKLNHFILYFKSIDVDFLRITDYIQHKQKLPIETWNKKE